MTARHLSFLPLQAPSVKSMDKIQVTCSLFNASANVKNIMLRQGVWPDQISDEDVLAHRFAAFTLVQDSLWWRLRQLMPDLHTFKLVRYGSTCRVESMRPSGANHISALDFNDDAMVRSLCRDYVTYLDDTSWKGDDHDLVEYGQAFNGLDPLHVAIVAAIESAVQASHL